MSYDFIILKHTSTVTKAFGKLGESSIKVIVRTEIRLYRVLLLKVCVCV